METVNMTFEQMCAMCGVLQVLCGKAARSGCGKGPYVGYL